MEENKFEYIFEHLDEDGRKLVRQVYSLDDIEKGDIIYDALFLIARRQYTERKDKNNTEIYKHDIVRLCTKSEFLDPIDWEIFEGVVKMIQGQWVIFDDKTNQPLYGFDDVEVIGNIYENPELKAKYES